MKWSEFKKQVDDYLKENEKDEDIDIGYIDICIDDDLVIGSEDDELTIT
tara:strand:- start:284 stop:430 length:147 start_codon:yes stop_codon:yes gene_type:complete